MKPNEEKYRIVSFLFIGVLLMFIAPILLTRGALFNFCDFSKTGQIGDTIGGITAPILNFIGIILIYMSFEQQKKANTIQIHALQLEVKRNEADNQYKILEQHYSEIKYEFDSLTYIPDYESDENMLEEESKGEEALELFCDDVDAYGDDIPYNSMKFEYNLSYLVLLIDSFIVEFNKSKISEEAKNYLFKKFFYFYAAKIEFNFDILVKSLSKHKNFNALRNDIVSVIQGISDISKKYNLISPNERYN